MLQQKIRFFIYMIYLQCSPLFAFNWQIFFLLLKSFYTILKKSRLSIFAQFHYEREILVTELCWIYSTSIKNMYKKYTDIAILRNNQTWINYNPNLLLCFTVCTKNWYQSLVKLLNPSHKSIQKCNYMDNRPN